MSTFYAGSFTLTPYCVLNAGIKRVAGKQYHSVKSQLFKKNAHKTYPRCGNIDIRSQWFVVGYDFFPASCVVSYNKLNKYHTRSHKLWEILFITFCNTIFFSHNVSLDFKAQKFLTPFQQ